MSQDSSSLSLSHHDIISTTWRTIVAHRSPFLSTDMIGGPLRLPFLVMATSPTIVTLQYFSRPFNPVIVMDS